MKILVACEESQRVCTAFRERGFETYSCDILPCSGGHPEWHIQGDCSPLLNGDCEFTTTDGNLHIVDGQRCAIFAFPPCTHLAVSGARYFEEKRLDGRQREAIDFFCNILEASCNHILVENPINIIGGKYIPKWFPDLAGKYNLPKKPTQIIQPWMFGHGETKATCLWLKNLPELEPTEIVDGRNPRVWYMSPSKDRSIKRSKTYEGVAKAMAMQYGEYLNDLYRKEI